MITPDGTVCNTRAFQLDNNKYLMLEFVNYSEKLLVNILGYVEPNEKISDSDIEGYLEAGFFKKKIPIYNFAAFQCAKERINPDDYNCIKKALGTIIPLFDKKFYGHEKRSYIVHQSPKGSIFEMTDMITKDLDKGIDSTFKRFSI